MNNFAGTIFLGRFRADTLLSAGASGSLYRGWDMKRNMPLAIKIYDAPVPNDPNALCFQQDEGTLQTLIHPSIAPFYGLFEDQGVSFLIEKYIDGQVLAQIQAQRNRQPFASDDALIILKSLAAALEYAHGFGLVHSSVNPFNILIGRDGAILLTNFGFARHADRTMSPAGLPGLPAYIAPEQLRGAPVSPATDVYALGMLFFELTTGVHPFLRIPTSQATADSTTLDRLRAAHLNQTPPDPRQFNPALPAGFSETLAVALAKESKQRYQSAQEMLEIICAVSGAVVQQIPDRIRIAGLVRGAPQPPTEILPGAAHPAGAPAPGGGQYPPATPGVGTQILPPSPANVAYPPARPGVSGTQVVPPAPGGANYPPAGAGPSGTQFIPPTPGGAQYPSAASGPSGTQYIPPTPGAGYYQPPANAYSPAGQGPRGTQMAPAAPAWGGVPPVAPSAPSAAYPVVKSRRLAWFWIAIGAVAVLAIVCGIAVGAGWPILQDLFGTQTPTASATLTFTPTSPPPTNTFALPASLPTATLIEPTSTEPPPPPTAIIIPTVAPLPTLAEATPTRVGQYGFKVTIHNGKSVPLYPFRDGQMLGNPIPPMKYIWYLNQPAGPHIYSFCVNPNMTNCAADQQVMVDKDLDIYIR